MRNLTKEQLRLIQSSGKSMQGHYSDHDAFMNGMDDNVGMGDFFSDVKAFFTPVVQQTLSNTQTALTQAGTNVINNQLASNPLLQAKTEDKLGETIKAGIMKNKWYIIGGLVGMVGLFYFVSRAANKK